MKNIRIISCLIIFLFVCTLPIWSIDKTKDLKTLADSARRLVGKKDFVPVNSMYMQLACELNDTIQMEDSYRDLFNHHYQLGEINALKTVCYEVMEWYAKRGKTDERYQKWREYIQRLTESGKQDEAIAETALLSKDAEKNNSRYGQACGEMCIGYNHRMFSNNVKLCIEYYNNALRIFEEANYYNDAYVVCLNIVQTCLSRQEYGNVLLYLDRMEKLAKKMKAANLVLRESLYLRFLQFRVITMLADKGKEAATEYILETDRYYSEHPECATRDAWLGYKILCCRTQGDVNGTLLHLDSLLDYHKSTGVCYPSNLLFKAQCLEVAGRLEEACKEYAYYAQMNDSVRSVELDDKLSKYTIQFDVDKLKMEKLELSAEANRNRLITVITISCCVFVLLIILVYLYIRTLAMNKKLDAANKEVIKASRIKSSFLQHITHEIRTPLNSIVGFSSLIATGEVSEEERRDYAAQIEISNTYLLNLVNNVVDIADMDSQTENAPKCIMDVDACCKECISEVRPTLRKEVELQYIPSSECVTMEAVYPWVKRVLITLLNNGAKFTNSGFIRLRYEHDKRSRLVRFVVEDSGPGIDEQYKDTIFERFIKVDYFTQGTGLGLAIAHQIMDIVDGRVYLDTTYKNGARFVVEWPVR